MDAYFWRFTKRENATTQPATEGNKVECVLKGPCSVQEPVLKIATWAGSSQAHLNYCYIPDFNRFYWIRDWVAEPGYNFVAYCTVDVLATYAAAIGASTQYILRSSNASNGDIVDELYPATAGVQTLVETHNGIWDAVNGASAKARFVLGVINNDAVGSMGSVSYYVLTGSALASFMNLLMSTTPTGYNNGDGGLTTQMYKAMYNPIQYIVSCIFMPIIPGTGAAVSNIEVGGGLNISGFTGVWELSTASLPAKHGSITIPKHPQASSRGRYLNMGPYSRYMLEFRPFGWIPLDPASLQGYSSLYYWVQIDPISGQGLLKLSTDSAGYNIVYEQTQLCGVPIQLAQLSRDVLGAATSAVGAIAGAAAGVGMGNIPGAIMSGLSGIGNMAQNLMPQVQTAGANGSISELVYDPTLVGRFLLVVDEDNDDRGRPYCHKGKISDTGGYLLIADPDVSITGATAAEMQKIKDYMAGGFFYV